MKPALVVHRQEDRRVPYQKLALCPRATPRFFFSPFEGYKYVRSYPCCQKGSVRSCRYYVHLLVYPGYDELLTEFGESVEEQNWAVIIAIRLEDRYYYSIFPLVGEML